MNVIIMYYKYILKIKIKTDINHNIVVAFDHPENQLFCITQKLVSARTRTHFIKYSKPIVEE